MRRTSTSSSMGAFHPVLFFMFIYGISLLLAIFVCRTVYYSLNSDPATEQAAQPGYKVTTGNATALR